MRMRIAMIASLYTAVPPIAYGATEIIMDGLIEALIRRGHEVTLFASGDSITSAQLVPGCETALRDSDIPLRDKHVLGMRNILNYLARAGDFDIVHNHTSYEGLGMAWLSATPCLTTIHGELGSLTPLIENYPDWFNTVSHSQGRPLLNWPKYMGAVHNAIDVNSFPFSERKRDGFLLFLALIIEKKGPHIAIEVARRLKIPLIIAGRIGETKEDEEFFYREIKPLIDGDRVRFFEEADQKQKRDLLSRADALIAALGWEEPFGVQFIEAMACGTPVVAFNRGAVPEIIVHGTTGFIVANTEEMVEAVREISLINPRDCREHVEQYFNMPRLIDDYIRLYQTVINESKQRGVVDLSLRSNGEAPRRANPEILRI